MDLRILCGFLCISLLFVTYTQVSVQTIKIYVRLDKYIFVNMLVIKKGLARRIARLIHDCNVQ